MVISSYKWLICSWLWFRSYGFLLILLCHVFLSDLLVERAPWWTLYILFCNDDSSLFQSWWRDNFPNWRSTQYSTQCIFNEYVRSYSRRVCQEAFKLFKVLAQYLFPESFILNEFWISKKIIFDQNGFVWTAVFQGMCLLLGMILFFMVKEDLKRTHANNLVLETTSVKFSKPLWVHLIGRQIITYSNSNR